MVTLRMYVYDVNMCGYYNEHDAHILCNIAELIDDLSRWISSDSKTLQDTKVFDVSDGGDSDLEMTYIYDIVKVNNNYLITTWNKNETVDDMTLMARKNDKPGNIETIDAVDDEEYIVGYPCYFMFIPNKKFLISILLDGQKKRGIKNLQYYMNIFMKHFSSFVVEDCDSDGCVRLGYGTVKEFYSDIEPYFKVKLKRKLGQIEYLKANASKIRKVTHKNMLDNDLDKKVITRILEKLTGKYNDSHDDDLEYKIEFEYNGLVSEDIDTILETYKNYPTDQKFNDVGFTLIGESSHIYWVSNSICKAEEKLALTKKRGILKGIELLSELNERIEKIIIRAIKE